MPIVTADFRWRSLAPLALVLIAALSSAALAAPAPIDEKVERHLVSTVNSAEASALAALPGMTGEAAAKVVAHRKGGTRITSAEDLRRVAGLTDDQLARLIAHFASMPRPKLDETLAPGDELGVLPDPSKAAQVSKGSGSKKGLAKPPKGAVKEGEAKPAAEAPVLDLEVTPNYFSILPGYDLSNVPEEKARLFLDTINKEICSCGCGHTVAFCFVNDPDCPVVKARVRKIYTDIVGAPPTAPAPSKPAKP